MVIAPSHPKPARAKAWLPVVALSLLAALNTVLHRNSLKGGSDRNNASFESRGLHIPHSISGADLALTFHPSSVKMANARTDNKAGRPKMLIAQYDAGPEASSDQYRELLNATSLINRAYAETHGHDYLLLRGFYLLPPNWRLPRRRALRPPAALATYNKLALLHLALENKQYDRLLMLDSDALLVDFTVDVAMTYPIKREHHDDILLVAQRVSGNNNNS